jgi:predicted ATPase/class 3 adenylate cyclase
MRRDLPSGTVTFLFTDVEGSTKLLHELGAADYAKALADHRGIVRGAFGAYGGVEVDTQGDAFFVAFPTAPGALAAASEALEGFAPGPIQVRMGIHTGTPHVSEEGYVGADVHRAARIAACGHGGQVLISASTASLLGTDGLRDLGEHRLKDLSAPERIYQLGDDDFPPLATLHQTNLPVPSTPFLGREKELAEVLGLLSREDVRLLTLTGAGGSGKTRLALQAAGELADGYRHGVWWVPLAALRDPELVLAAGEQALGAKNGLAEHIADRSLLLLFDNFEHIVEAAPDLAALLASCPNLDLLVTSREPLHITGEQEYPVPPLVHEEGVDLFLARARAVKPDFEADATVSEICRRLDELPLALELAAARVKALSSGQILERLQQRLPLLTGGARDLPARQRTLRATIAWSYELLTPEEQHLFARLAVFRGACTLEAAEEVTEADLDTLESLVDKSLVRHTHERFWMLETIREYAAERLEDSGQADELRRRHAEHFLALAEEAQPHVRVEWLQGGREWRDRLEREHDNLRAALDLFEAAAETELALRLAGALSEFWQSRGHVAEGRRRLESALHADERPTAARATALSGAANTVILSDPTAGRLWAEEALTLHRTLGDAWGTAESLQTIGYALAEEGDPVSARPLLEGSIRMFRELGDEHYALWTARTLGWTYYEVGDLERARALHEDTLRRAHALGNTPLEAALRGSLAMIAVDQGRVEDALSLLRGKLALWQALGDRRPACRVLRSRAGGDRRQRGVGQEDERRDARHRPGGTRRRRLRRSVEPRPGAIGRGGRRPRRERTGLAAVAKTLRFGQGLEALERAVFDLADALARDAERTPDLLERERLAAEQAVAELDHLPVPVRQRIERPLHVLPSERERRRVERGLGAVVLDEVAELALLLLADRLLQRDRKLRHAEDLANLLGRHLELVRDLLRKRLPPESLDELPLDVHDLVQLLDHVDGDPDRPRLVGDRPRHSLADPPGRVGRELEALAVVELLDRADQAERALLNQVEKGQAPPQVTLRDRDDEPKVRLDHLRLRVHVAALDPLGEVDLLVGGQERHFPDLTEVEAQRVERRLHGQVELGCFPVGLLRPRECRLLVRWMLVLLAFDELDRVVDQVGVEVFDLLLGQLDFLERRDDFVVREEPLLLSLLDEPVELFDVGKRDVDREQCGPRLSPCLDGVWSGTRESRSLSSRLPFRRGGYYIAIHRTPRFFLRPVE